MLQHGSFVVNTARASLICKDAICSLIESSHIAGFASDVFWDEYAENLDPQLESLRKRGYNIVMSPHIGGCTLSSMQKTEMFIAGNTSSSELKEMIKGFMLSIISKIRLEKNIIVNDTQLDNLFKKGEL